MKLLRQLKEKSRSMKKEINALFLAYRRPEMPWYGKILAVIVLGYALSPIDLIPDFIPILGYLDDLVLIPLGIALVIKLVPLYVMEECRNQAEENMKEKRPKSWRAGAVIILIWMSVISMILLRIFY